MTSLTDPGLTAELEARCLRGLAAAAAALAGDEPAAVCATFATWRAEARRPWPWLPGLCYTALEDLGVSFPDQDDAAIVLGRMLIASEDDSGAAARALAALPDSPAASAGPGLDAGVSLRRRTLLLAVDRFWEDLTSAMRRVHEPVLRGDRDAADWIVVAARRQLQDEGERIRELAARVGQETSEVTPLPQPEPEPELEPEPEPEPELEAEPEPAPPPAEDHPDAPDPVHDATELLDPAALAGYEDTGPIGDPGDLDATGPLEPADLPRPRPIPPPAGGVATGAGSPRPAGRSPSRPSPASPPRRPVRQEDIEYRRVREHTYAPVVFLVVLVLVALVVLATVGSP